MIRLKDTHDRSILPSNISLISTLQTKNTITVF